MKMRNILSNRKAGKRLARKTISPVLGNDSHDSDAALTSAKHRSATYAVNRDAIDQVAILGLQPSANLTGKKTKGLRVDSRVAKPTNFNSNFEMSPTWHEWYGILWELKGAEGGG